MSSDSSDTAIAFVDRQVEQWISTNKDTRPRSAEEIALWWGLGFEHTNGAGQQYMVADVGATALLFGQAAVDQHARNLLSSKVVSKLYAGAILTRAEAEFAALTLSGHFPPLKQKPGIPRSELFERNMFIIALMQALVVEFDMTPTRNTEKAGEYNSAADIIANSFVNHGKHEVTFLTVKQIWGKTKLRKVCEVIWKLIDEHSIKPRGGNALAGNWKE